MLPRPHAALGRPKVTLPLEGRTESQGRSAARGHRPSSPEPGEPFATGAGFHAHVEPGRGAHRSQPRTLHLELVTTRVTHSPGLRYHCLQGVSRASGSPVVTPSLVGILWC